MGRIVALITLVVFLIIRQSRPGINVPWLPFLILQGLLDSAGYLTLLRGSYSDQPEITAVIASAFGIVTIVLAWLIIRETIRRSQWFAISLVFSSIAILVAND